MLFFHKNDVQEFSLHTARRFKKFFSENAFWDKVRKEATNVGASVLYVALQLFYVLTSGRVSLRERGFIIGALGYLILPADLIPDLIPAIGYSDDLAALMAVFTLVNRNVDDEIRQRAKDTTRSLLGDIPEEVFSRLRINKKD